MQPPCTLCSTLLPILDKCKQRNATCYANVQQRNSTFSLRLDSSLELIEALDLHKDDICTFVTFVTNWPQS
jgi:hypothetical protein